MGAKVTWNGKMSFTGTAGSGFSVALGTAPEVGGDNDGFRPMELLAISLAGCTGMDVISILRKKRQDVTRFEVFAHTEQATTHPKVYIKIQIEYVVEGNNIDPEAVIRAIELSTTAYCPVQNMLGKSVEIEHKHKIIQNSTKTQGMSAV
jgi:putative redox protein